MTVKEIYDKIGAMHLRFQDEEDNYVQLVNLLMEYQEQSDQYGLMVSAALKDGLKNYERYLKLDSALSPRSIIIEEKSDTEIKNITKADAEGRFRIVFVMDDESRQVVHFGRKQSHLLYILLLLCSQKNGLLADFFQMEDNQVTPVLGMISLMAKVIYPYLDDAGAMRLVKDLAPDRSFTDIFQKMKVPIVKCLKKAKLSDDLYWYMPYAVNLKRKQLYQMHIPQTKIIYPPVFQPFIKNLPDAVDILQQEGIDSQLVTDMDNDFAYWKQKADEGNAEGLYYTGVYYGTGDVVSQDYKQSYSYLKQAADKGHLDALFQMGVYHMFGYGVKKDIRQAIDCFERAAKRGHAEAAAWAGQIYESGTNGMKVNHKKAFDLYMIAARQDNEEAIWYVIQGYLLGQGVKQNYDEALGWLEIARYLEYYNISVLFGIWLFNQGDEKSLDMALELFLEGCAAKIPLAYYMMAKITLIGYRYSDSPMEEYCDLLFTGAELGDEHCINAMKKDFPDEYEEYKETWKKPLSMLDMFRALVLDMDYSEQENFIQMVDAYRERWHNRYLVELCKQLSIHKPHDDEGGEGTIKRKITVRKSKSGKLPYELVLTLANGEEVIVNKMNINSMVLMLLTIICSYKSGYCTVMAKDKQCKPLLMELARLTNNQVTNLAYYVEAFMGYEKEEVDKKNEDYYKQYSNIAKKTMKEAIGHRDDAIFFLFDNDRIDGRKYVRRTVLDPQDIELPPELMDLAIRMPDAMNVIQGVDSQKDTDIIAE